MRNGCYVLKKEDLDEGIKHCFNKAKSLVEDCDYLFRNKKNMNIVLGLYTLSLEEFGKGLLLHDLLSKPKKEYNIPIQYFGRGRERGKAHKRKIDRTFKELPEDCRRFYPAVLLKWNTRIENQTITVGPEGRKVTVAGGTTGIYDAGLYPDDFIHREGNEESDFDNDFVADFSARMRCFFVDWDEKNRCWRWGVSISEKNMNYIISELKQKIEFHNGS